MFCHHHLIIVIITFLICGARHNDLWSKGAYGYGSASNGVLSKKSVRIEEIDACRHGYKRI